MNEFFDRLLNELKTNPIISALDIILYAFLLYALFLFLKKNHAKRFIKFVVIFLLISAVLSSEFLGFKLLGKLFSLGLIILFTCLFVLFPQEIRRGLWKVSTPKDTAETFSTSYNASDEELKTAIDNIVRAALTMAKKDVGALIVIAPEAVPPHILESGTKLDSFLSSQLLESIFVTKGPLHDGAVIIRGNRVLAAGCFLPLTQNLTVDKELGTRHRAAIGVSEVNNVLTIIISEETGVISVAYAGDIKRYYDSAMLSDTLSQVYGLKATEISDVKNKKRRKLNERKVNK